MACALYACDAFSWRKARNKPTPAKVIEALTFYVLGIAATTGFSRGSRANASLPRNENSPAAPATSISRFHECVLTTLGTATSGFEASKPSPKVCCPALIVPGRSQLGFGSAVAWIT